VPEAGFAGLGLQFLKLDGESARLLDEYVYERAALDGLVGEEAAVVYDAR
jgi:hypothetical protein